MKVTTVTYTATINLGNYESEKIEVTAHVEESDNVAHTIDALRNYVDANTFRPGWVQRQREAAKGKPVAEPRPAKPDPFDGME